MGKTSRKKPFTPALFLEHYRRKHPRLFLQKLLTQEGNSRAIEGPELDNAIKILGNWADLADAGHLLQKETALDAEFIEKVFGDALGYRSVSENPTEYHREKQFAVAGAGTADGALGRFGPGASSPSVLIELKGAGTDLDHDKVNGRTPVQQLWDYLNQLPGTPWGIVSNYITIRLYHRGSPARAYEEFTYKDFRDPARVRQFFHVFRRAGLLGTLVQKPLALDLLVRSGERQREVGDKLYAYYSEQRRALVETLMTRHGHTQDRAISAAQRILDRIVFIAFCEDRGLLPQRLIEKTVGNAPPFAPAGSEWRALIECFRAIDKGHPGLDPPEGYNGGLFREDPDVDDLRLEDRWAQVAKTIGDYDFKDEVNVEVLGHLFEMSVTELEKLRVVGLFGRPSGAPPSQGGAGGGSPTLSPATPDPSASLTHPLPGREGSAAMPKSAERKRFGIYYTPPEFTHLIVEQTLGQLIAQRVDPLPDLDARVAALRTLRVCDPACGSGAFLIAAYDRLEQSYEDIARLMRIAGRMSDAAALVADHPGHILTDNLYGVDLSAESVEITQLALWIRSARKGRSLADLSRNILHGNSLVSDPAVHPRAFDWRVRFPQVFVGDGKGFDAVIGNPPWERMKLQEREFFSLAAPEIAGSVSAADRRKLVAAVQGERPELWERYRKALAAAEATLAHVRAEEAGYPLTGKGDVNTYMLFAELARRILAPTGRAGLLVPSGIATDHTTKEFFGDLMDGQRLIALYDFENRKRVFPDVDSRFKFSALLMGGSKVTCEAADFVFFAHEMEDLDEAERHIALSPKDLRLLNPNTRTCPIFRSRRDAEITRGVYRRVPVLVDRNRKKGGNPWGVKFSRMFDQTNDAELFVTGDKLKADGYRLDGNRWVRRKEVFLPLYEAKMIQAYDHRAAGVRVEKGNWMRQGQPEETTLVEHQNPEFVVQPRWWVEAARVSPWIGDRPAVLAYKDVTSATNQRTMIAAMVPAAGLVNSAPFLRAGDDITLRRQACLLANMNSLAYDFIARQKVGGLHLNFFIVEQLPTLPPDRYDEKCPWAKRTTLEAWIAERALKLTCVSEDMQPLAAAAGFKAGTHKWRDAERAQLRAELDAAYFLLYGIGRDDVGHILGTFQGIRDEDAAATDGLGATRAAVLDGLDRLQAGKE